MLKKTVWILIILSVVLGFFVGKKIYDSKFEKDSIVAEEGNEIKNNVVKNEIAKTEIETNSKNEKISINTVIVEETYYKDCDHLVKEEVKDKEKYINLTEEGLKEKFKDWEVKRFGKDKVILYREAEKICDEHYILKDVNGYVTVYSMAKDDSIKDEVLVTDIATEYLTDTDKKELEEGIKVYTRQNLNKLIEDFE